MKGILSLRWKSWRGKAKKIPCFARRRLFFPPKPKILDQTLTHLHSCLYIHIMFSITSFVASRWRGARPGHGQLDAPPGDLAVARTGILWIQVICFATLVLWDKLKLYNYILFFHQFVVVSTKDVCELAQLLMKEIAGNWELFLGFLGVPNGIRKQIQAKHPHSVEMCVWDGLEHWVRSEDTPTYEKIVEMLRTNESIINKRLASDVEELARQKQSNFCIFWPDVIIGYNYRFQIT